MAEKIFYLAACCILKDEDPFLAEWFSYHTLIGVEHFFVYDNSSRNPARDNPFIRTMLSSGRLTLTPADGPGMQLPVYAHCLATYGPLCKWLAFIDLDEFVCPLREEDLRFLLTEYEEFSCLALNWKCFGSGGRISRPPGLVLRNYRERFVKRYARNFHVKSLVQPDRAARVNSPHSFCPRPGETAVNDVFRPLPPGCALAPVSWERACVNHYLFKSQQDFEHRLRRGRSDIPFGGSTLSYTEFYGMLEEKQETDESILRFAPALEESLAGADAGLAPFSPAERDLPEIPDNSPLELYTRLAGLCMRDGRFSAAELLLCRASLYHADKAQLWVVRASLARRLEQPEKALRFLKKAFSLDELPQTYEELLDITIRSGRKREARAVLEFMLTASTVRTDSRALNHKLDTAGKLLNYAP
ncbi:MAG: glycosyltransferase family 92 protein [Deltaproteobacteria bacterium]|jgi:hypothetical protein|nr:glycosyltransferase family 92 protein [Deltaproteobacteria bacterium]